MKAKEKEKRLEFTESACTNDKLDNKENEKLANKENESLKNNNKPVTQSRNSDNQK
jgi:hypothetical protein